MKKRDIVSSLIIGEICAIIFLLFMGPKIEIPIIVKIKNFLPIILPLLSLFGIWFVSLFEEKMPVIFQAGKSFLVGILNTFIDLGILTILMTYFNVFSGLSFSVFKGVSFSGATLNSYFWNKFWTFKKEGSEQTLKETSQFYLITTGGFLINLAISSFVVNVITPQFGLSQELWAYVGAITAVFFGFIWNFVGYKLIVFKD